MAFICLVLACDILGGGASNNTPITISAIRVWPAVGLLWGLRYRIFLRSFVCLYSPRSPRTKGFLCDDGRAPLAMANNLDEQMHEATADSQAQERVDVVQCLFTQSPLMKVNRLTGLRSSSGWAFSNTYSLESLLLSLRQQRRPQESTARIRSTQRLRIYGACFSTSSL